MDWASPPSESDRFVEDLMRHMTLEEKIGQLDLEHPGDDPGIEDAVASGRVGGVLGARVPHRLQHLAMERSRLGLPLLLVDPCEFVSGLPDFALAASWDCDLVKAWGAVARAAVLRNGHNAMRIPSVASGMVPGLRPASHLNACEPKLLARLTEAFAIGAGELDGAIPQQVLLIPHWSDTDTDAERQWAENLACTDSIVAIDAPALPGRDAAFRGFSGLLWSECRKILAAITDVYSTTRTRSVAEAAERAIAEGAMTLGDIDYAVRGVLAAKHALGLFRAHDRAANDHGARRPLPSLGETRARSMVLLRNEAGLLPLSPVSDRVLVVGPSDGAAADCLEALARSSIAASAAPGLAVRSGSEDWLATHPGDHFAMSLTRDAARRADFALVVLDDRHFVPSEGGRWEEPTQPATTMVSALASSGVRLVAIVATQNPVDLATIDQHFSAVLLSWETGEGYEAALAAILSGRSEPQGRLPVAMGRYPFGHGIGFSETVFSGFRVELLQGVPTITLNVRNAGTFAVRETVQVYIAGPATTEAKLAQFVQPVLAPGETVTVSIPLDAGMLLEPKRAQEKIPAAGRYTVLAGKDRDRLFSAEFTLTDKVARALAMGSGPFLKLAAG